jgi:predicted TPR repeat methyltransferase
MTSYDRYEGLSADQCVKKSLMYYICRVPANKNLIPAVLSLENKKVLDVGLGSGYYTQLLLKNNNSVVGIDQNPHLCKLPVKVYKADASGLSDVVKDEKFDVVLSTWMTDYLSPEIVEKFFIESKKVLRDGGKLMATFPDTYGIGYFYVWAARHIRKVQKYTHNKKNTIAMLEKAGFTEIKIVKLNSWLCIPWAFLIIAK